MPRKTRYIIYVDKRFLEDHKALFDATFKHFLKKDEEKKAKKEKSNVDFDVRKVFVAEYMRAKGRGTDAALKLINEWVQIRDAADFPYRKNKNTENEEANGNGTDAEND